MWTAVRHDNDSQWKRVLMIITDKKIIHEKQPQNLSNYFLPRPTFVKIKRFKSDKMFTHYKNYPTTQSDASKRLQFDQKDTGGRTMWHLASNPYINGLLTTNYTV